MISQIVDPPGACAAAAQELAEQIARNSPAAMAATKRALWGALELGLTDACRAGAQELVSLWGHPDQEEGPWPSPRSARPGGPRSARRGTGTPGDPVRTVAEALGRGLGLLGVGALYGRPLGGLALCEAPDEAAGVLMEAHTKLTGSASGFHFGQGRMVLGYHRARSGSPPTTVGPVTDAAGVPDALAELAGALDPDRDPVELHLGLDPAQPAAAAPFPLLPSVDRWVSPPEPVVGALQRASRPVVLVGPGILQRGATAGLHALAAAGHLGVLNTFGAKGVFDWRSQHHWATVGLQARDLARGGLSGSDLVLTSGLGVSETPGDLAAFGPVHDVHPFALAPLAEVVTPGRRDP